MCCKFRLSLAYKWGTIFFLNKANTKLTSWDFIPQLFWSDDNEYIVSHYKSSRWITQGRLISSSVIDQCKCYIFTEIKLLRKIQCAHTRQSLYQQRIKSSVRTNEFTFYLIKAHSINRSQGLRQRCPLSPVFFFYSFYRQLHVSADGYLLLSEVQIRHCC